MHIHPIFYVYILECADTSYYTGVTNDLDRRVNEHQIGKHPGSYTYERRPVELVFYETFTDPEMAIAFEKKIKSWSRAKKKALIDENYHLLPSLAKKKFK
ncbi:MAG: GIY-YIG nuclease family protein [Bacteroidota bacterium]